VEQGHVLGDRLQLIEALDVLDVGGRELSGYALQLLLGRAVLLSLEVEILGQAEEGRYAHQRVFGRIVDHIDHDAVGFPVRNPGPAADLLDIPQLAFGRRRRDDAFDPGVVVAYPQYIAVGQDGDLSRLVASDLLVPVGVLSPDRIRSYAMHLERLG